MNARAVPELQCVLWDFSGTLADESFLEQGLGGSMIWATTWQELLGSELMDRWDVGAVHLEEICDWFGRRIDKPPRCVMHEMTELCQDVELYSIPTALVERVTLPQALVTIHGDLFRSVIAPRCGFDELFEAIVVSCEERTSNKARLCEIATERLGCDPDHALLIDNLTANVTQWTALGRPAYLFTTEQQFQQDLNDGVLAPLAARIAGSL